jgi:hypothetical protein
MVTMPSTALLTAFELEVNSTSYTYLPAGIRLLVFAFSLITTIPELFAVALML